MAYIYRKEEKERDAETRESPMFAARDQSNGQPRWVMGTFFAALVGILIFGASGLDWTVKGVIVGILIGLVLFLMYRYFSKEENFEWGYETWDLTKKIFPLLIVGTFIVGLIAFVLPPETFTDYLGGNSFGSVTLASLLGVILYMPTLLEVPIIGTTFGYTEGVMGGGPALALLLSGPTVSLPSLAVLIRIMGVKKTAVYAVLVLIMSIIAGMIYGTMIG